MFQECEKFNQDLSHWNISNIEKMSCMFWKCKNFNQDLDSWDVSNIKNINMAGAFKGCPTTPAWYDRKRLES